VSRHLSWSHFLVLIPLNSNEQRDFYGNLASNRLIGVRELGNQISKKAYERTEKADIQLYDSNIAKETFKDPYILDFQELKDG